MTTQTRHDEIKTIHIKYRDFYRIGGGLFIILILIIIGSWIFGQNQLGFAETMLGYVSNVATEALSVIATIIVVDQLNHRRSCEERKLSLFRQVKSRPNHIASEALSQIQHEGWWDELLEFYRREDNRVDLLRIYWAGNVRLQGVNLQGADLRYANLQDANLGYTNLQEVNLRGANLIGVNLEEANLQRADLDNANLQKAWLVGANLERAFLSSANLQRATLRDVNLLGAYLMLANFEGTNLEGANLQGADLGHANLLGTDLGRANLFGASLISANLQKANLAGTDLSGANLYEADLQDVIWEQTIQQTTNTATLPDGTQWTPKTDMSRFTDPDHPEYKSTLAKISAIRKEKGYNPI